MNKKKGERVGNLKRTLSPVSNANHLSINSWAERRTEGAKEGVLVQSRKTDHRPMEEKKRSRGVMNCATVLSKKKRPGAD